MKWFEKFVAGKSVVLEDTRDVGMHGLVITNSSHSEILVSVSENQLLISDPMKLTA